MPAPDFPLQAIQQRFKAALQASPRLVGNDAVNFFKDSFTKQGWLGNTFQPWKPRKKKGGWGKKKNDKGRAILVQTARLKRSIRITSANPNDLTVRVGTDVPYARAHNEGSTKKVTQNVKSFQRKVTKLSKSGKSRIKVRNTTVKAHQRTIQQRLPKRQFMGQSPYLTAKMKRTLNATLMKALKP